MTAEEIRNEPMPQTSSYWLREIAAQLAELVEIQKYIIYGQENKREVK